MNSDTEQDNISGLSAEEEDESSVDGLSITHFTAILQAPSVDDHLR